LVIGPSRRSSSRAPSLAVLAWLLLSVACGNKAGPGGGPPPAEVIKFNLAPDIRIENVFGELMSVSFPLPTATGGVPPLTITCTPNPGAFFPLGTTVVQCNASDGVRFATTQFSVTLVAFVPIIGATSFLAVGDSITAGENGIDGPPDILSCGSSKLGIRPTFIDLCNSYPMLLENMLAARYTSQTPVVMNVGALGQKSGETLSRLPGYLGLIHPEGLLLQVGINDLPGSPDAVIANLRACIQVAKNSGVTEVFLSTLLPLKAGWRIRDSFNPLILIVNDRIRGLAAEQNVVLVDNGAAFFSTDYNVLLSDDGEHLVPAGYKLMAEKFFDAIKTRFEQPGPSALDRRRR
jgi:lysophospholipase L1-like esterase